MLLGCRLVVDYLLWEEKFTPFFDQTGAVIEISPPLKFRLILFETYVFIIRKVSKIFAFMLFSSFLTHLRLVVASFFKEFKPRVACLA